MTMAKIRIPCAVLAVAAAGLVEPARAAPAAGDGTMVLSSPQFHGGTAAWRMERRDRAPADGAAVSAAAFDAGSWSNAIVPGTVLNSLVAQGVYPEPYFGMNNALTSKLIPDISQTGRDFYTYWFRTEFALSPAFEGRRVVLELDGINYRAAIWLNGRKVSDMAGMFNRGYFDVTDLVDRRGRNALAILVEPPDVVGACASKKGKAGAAGENANGGDRKFGQNVTMLMSVSWDFTMRDGIRDRNTGIWREVKLVPSGPVTLRNPFVKSKLPLPALAPARETVVVEAVNLTQTPQRGVLRGRIPAADIAVEQRIELAAGETKEVVFTPEAFPALVLAEPRLWWPLGKGPQNLYDLELEFDAGAGPVAVGSRAHTRFGIREITSDQNTPDKSRIFYVNGRRLFIRGSNWIPEAMLRTSDERTRAELRWTAQAGVNMLRIWGGGIAESDTFFDLCDEYGILVWSEFWQTGDTDLPADTELYRANIVDTVKRIRPHASQAYYVSANERDAKGIIPILDLLEKLDGTRGYQPGSETDGVHDGSPYATVNPMWYYEDTGSARGSRINGFNPEYGTACLPTPDCLREMMDEQDLWPINTAVWDYHDGGGFHGMTRDYRRCVEQYGASRGIEEFAMKAQAYGGLANRAIWECWSRNKFEYGDRFCSGFLFWYHNCPLRQVCGRMWDWSLEPTAALYFTQDANEPIHAQFDFLKDTVSLVNEHPWALEGHEVSIRIFNPDMTLVWEKKVRANAPADGVTNDLIRVEWPANLAPVHFLRLDVRDAKGAPVSDTFYWRSNKPYERGRTWTGPQFEGFESLTALPAAEVELRVAEGRRDRFETRTVTARNPSKQLAFLVWLRLQRADDGKPVRPAFYSDNFFSLLPGEEKTVTIEYEAKHAGPGGVKLALDGWNVVPRVWRDGALQPAASGAAGQARVQPAPAAPAAPAAVTPAGPAKAPADGRTARASSVETPDRAAGFAIDGDPQTRWSSLRTDPQWLSVDLGKTQTVSGVELQWEEAFAREYRIELSLDGTNWTRACEVRDGKGGLDVRRFAPAPARCVRMYGEKRATKFGYSLFELRVLTGEAKAARQ